MYEMLIGEISFKVVFSLAGMLDTETILFICVVYGYVGKADLSEGCWCTFMTGSEEDCIYDEQMDK